MGREEDDLMKDQNLSDDFEFDDMDDDNLTIPDSPYGNDGDDDDHDSFASPGEDFDLGDGLEEDALEDLADLADLHDNGIAEEEFGNHEFAENVEMDEEEEDDEPEEFKLGWKVYLGIAATAAAFVVGASMYLFGDSSTAQQRPQPMSAQELQQMGTRHAAPEQPQQQAVHRDLGQEGIHDPSISSPVSSTHELTPGASPVEHSTNQRQDVGGMHGGPTITGDATRETTERVVADKEDLISLMEGEFVGLNDFKALRGSMDAQGRRLSRVSDDLTETKLSLGDLEDRVAKLENSGATSPEKTAPPKKAESKSLQPSETVREAQIRLRAFNYRPGPIDGLMGDRTVAAIKRFQKQEGLTTTGDLNEETVAALKENTRMYAGTYAETRKAPASTKVSNVDRWYVRGVTSARAIIYKKDGKSYAVGKGTEVPGFGQVKQLDPVSHKVITTKGSIGLE